MENTPIKRGPGRPRKDAVRDDGPYANFVMGLGTKRDPSSYTQASSARIFSEGELEALYINDGFARRIIDVPAQDMVRAGFCIEVEGEDDEEKEDLYKPVMARLEELKALEHISEAEKLARLFGGSLVVLGIMDGGALEEPLNENAVKGVEFLRVYDRYRVSRMVKYTDPADKRYGQTQIYLVSPVNGNPYQVHESRCMVFQGEYIPERMREIQDGWSASTLAKCWYQLQRLGVSHMWAEKLLERAQQAVAKVQGMSQQLGAPGGQNALMNRAHLLDMSRSALNSVMIDAQDDYTITSSSFAGVPDILDRFATALAGVTGMPKTLLFGEQAKGLGNANEGDLQNWYAQIKQWQKDKLLSHLDRLVSMLAKSEGLPEQDYMIEFKPLHVPSAKEEAETDKLKADKRKVEADTAVAYVTAGALDPSELRETLLASGDYVMDASVKIEPVEDDGGEV